jgi:hypothetical protein
MPLWVYDLISQVCFYNKLLTKELKSLESCRLDKMQLNFQERDFVMHIINIVNNHTGKSCNWSANWATRSGRFEYVIFRNWSLVPSISSTLHQQKKIIFQISLVVLIINCIPSRVITYSIVTISKNIM